MKVLNVSHFKGPWAKSICLCLLACLFVFLNSYTIKGTTTYQKFTFFENKTTYDFSQGSLSSGSTDTIDWDNYNTLPADTNQVYVRVSFEGGVDADSYNSPQFVLYPPRITGTPNNHGFFTDYVDHTDKYCSEYGFVECDDNHQTKWRVDQCDANTGTVYITLLGYAEEQ